MDTFWLAISAVSSALSVFCAGVSALILFVTALIIRSELEEVRKANYANAYKAARDILQAEDLRQARDTVMNVLANKPFESFQSWNDQEIAEARKVCQSFDSVGQMIRSGMLPTASIADSWGAPLRETWRILSPMVVAFRAKINATEYWDDYEWLAKQAEGFQRPLHKNK